MPFQYYNADVRQRINIFKENQEIKLRNDIQNFFKSQESNSLDMDLNDLNNPKSL